jgi:PAS domain S-box-containing protein
VKSILYIDNDPVLLDEVRRFLERDSDIRVETSQSAMDALHLLKTESYNAIISEYEMPAMDGIQLLKTIREKNPKLPFIFFTNKNREEIIEEALKNGADHYVKKGEDQKSRLAELSHEIRRAVEFREIELKIIRLNRIDSMHRRINEAVVHINDHLQLVHEVCKIMVQEGGFVMAWIGFMEPHTHRITTVFASGAVDDFFGKVRILSEDIATGHGPTVTTLRNGKVTICNDIHAYPGIQMWEEDALRKGYRSAAAFPISSGITTHGVITLYSCEKNFFTEAEVGLLKGISDEISYVLNTMEMEETCRQAQEERELAIYKLSEIINFLPEATFAIDTAGTITTWNKAMEKLTSASAREVMGLGNYEYSFRILGERIPGLLDLVFAPESEIENYHYSAIQRSRGSIRAQIQIPDLKGKPATFEVVASLLYDKNGELSGAIQSMTDIRKIHQKDEKFYHVFETADNGLLILEPDTRKIIEANSSMTTLTGYSHEYLIGRKLEEIGFFKDSLPAEQFYTELKNTEHIHYKNIPLETVNGRVLDVEFFSKLTTLNGHQFIQCTVNNISSRKRAERAQTTARKSLDMLSSRIRHDILNQLMIIGGSLELASYGVQEPELQKHLTRAQTATKTIQKQILFTREYENLGAGIPIWQPVPTAIHHAFLEIETDSITLNLQPDIFEVFADPLFEKVFYLLFNFSHTFGEKITRIDVSYQYTRTELIIAISDNGIGIVPETKDHLFEWKPGNEKTFGLFLAEKILASTGLSIRETGEFRKGARFEIIIPRDSFHTISPP